jgi:2-polyprenyl-3-methyl-5-hydroxy-6-metoxy-1,4-benzoquinol methylase
MPVEPPPAQELPRFDPLYLTDDDLDDLATFTGFSREECLWRVRTYSLREMADAWRRADPKTPEEILTFYATTDLYIWELMQWHASEARRPYWQALQEVVGRFSPAKGYRRVLDFGCGIGTDGLYLANRGYDVTLADVDSPTFRFARHRFARRNLAARFITIRSYQPQFDQDYDIVICFDVFEHLPDPLACARRLVSALRPGGVIAQKACFADDGYNPQHLAAGVERFAGVRWHIALAGLGLRNVSGMVYRRTHGPEALIQKSRYLLWRVTRLWVSYVS